MITIVEYNRAEQIQPLAGLWDRLLERTPDACFSHTRDWVSALGSDSAARLRILVGFVAGRPFGLLPLQVETRKTDGIELRYLTNVGGSFCPFSGPIGPNTTAMLTAAMRHLHRTRRDWEVLDLDWASASESQQKRLSNTFRLMGWRVDAETVSEWLELSPEAVIPPRPTPAIPLFTFERIAAAEHPPSPGPFMARCLALVEECQGSEVAHALRHVHQSGFRAGIADWALLCENGVPQAAALNLLTRGRRLCTALVGRTDLARFELIRRLLRETGEDVVPFWFRSSQIPFPERWTNASRGGFRYTHRRPWSLKVRWLRFRQQFPSYRRREKPLETSPNSVEPSKPRAPKLTLFHPSAAESLKA